MNVSKVNTNELSESDKIYRDFRSEWENHHFHFPYIEIIKENEDFKNAFYSEFAAMPAKPKLLAYIRNFISDKEWENDQDGRIVRTSELEKKHLSLETEFYRYKNNLPHFGYGRSLRDTETARLLTAIESELQNFRDYVLTNTDEHQYNSYAKVTADKIISDAKKISIPHLGKAVIEKLFDKASFVSWDMKFYLEKYNDAQRRDTKRRYSELEKYFNAAMKEKLQDPSNEKLVSFHPSSIKNHMTQGNYIDLILNGYVNHREFLSEFFFREYKHAQEKHIGFSEFFKRILAATKLLIDEIQLRRFEELNKWGLAKSQMQSEGKWTEELEQASKLDDREFSVHLHSFTQGRYVGSLFASEIAYINESISNALNMVAAEMKPNTLAPTAEAVNSPLEINLKAINNRFDTIPIKDVYQYFKTRLVDKNHLSEEALLLFLNFAFDKREKMEEKLTFQNVQSKQKIMSVFGNYYRKIAGKPHGQKSKYVALLCDYFEGFSTTNVTSNFSR